MEKRCSLNIAYTVLVTSVVALFIGLFLYVKNQDTNFSRRIFAGLIKGNSSVQKLIDWPNFQAVGVDVGRSYSILSNDKEKADYRRAFIEKFGSGFRQTGAGLKSFINWRVNAREADSIIVAADCKDKAQTILFTLSKDGRKKLAAIQWEDLR